MPADEHGYREKHGSEAYIQRLQEVSRRNDRALEECSTDDERIVVQHMIHGSVFEKNQSFFGEPQLLYRDFRGKLDTDGVRSALSSLEKKNVVRQVDLGSKLSGFELVED